MDIETSIYSCIDPVLIKFISLQFDDSLAQFFLDLIFPENYQGQALYFASLRAPHPSIILCQQLPKAKRLFKSA